MLAGAEAGIALCDDDTKIIPGHGPLSGKTELIAYRDMLRGVRAGIEDEIGRGRSLEQILEAHPTAAFDAVWGGGFVKPDDFVKLVHASLTRAR
jgi:hypothetical protein